jgi:uncharacterized protein YndB with AHSA1/START domain
MELETIKKSIDIKAPKEKVWSVLFGNETYPLWAGFFSEGSIAETDWEAGSKAIFKDKSNSGIVGTIIKNISGETLAIEYYAELKDGVEDRTSESAKSIIGAIETYKLTDKDGGTHLAIESDMTEKFFEMMSKAWDKALLKIKDLAEK